MDVLGARQGVGPPPLASPKLEANMKQKLFEYLKERDIIAPVAQLFKAGDLILKDGKACLGVNMSNSSPELEWMFGRMPPDRNCFLWHRIYLMAYNLIPKECYGCWKIVARPKNISQLMKIYEIQQKTKAYGKCGIERRPFCTYKGWYAAFWYCPLGKGLAKAKELYEEVADRLHREVSLELPVILKRACTEMEEMVGATNLWKKTEAGLELQERLDAFYNIKTERIIQPPEFDTHIRLLWLRYAFEHGDPTVAEFCENYPESFGTRPTVTYHDKEIEIVDRRGADGEASIESL